MISANSILPDNIDELKQMILSSADTARFYEQENRLLREQIRLLHAKLYGRKTEKLPGAENIEQPSLFNEAEETVFQAKETAEEVVEVPAHTRKKRGRKAIPDDLPRVEVVHDVSEENKKCACGAQKSRIGEEVSEQLDIIPAKIRVIRNIRPQYACKACEGVEDEGPTVTIAPMPEQMIPKSIASAGLLAQVLTAKFVDAIPFYRQEKQLERIGVEIPRATMCGWAIKVAERSAPLIELLKDEILGGPLINADETPVQVMNEPGRSNNLKSYMWVFRGGRIDSPGLLYQYHSSRSAEVAASFLRDFKGYIQTDGYQGYDFLDELEGVIHLGCWAHARRKFMEVTKAAGKGKTGSADVALTYIGKLYTLEKNVRLNKLSPKEIYRERQQKSKPILEEFRDWLFERTNKTPPKGLLGKAINYTLKQWDRLVRYIEDGRLRMDNNLAENAIRPFVVGRKNWLFSGHPVGAAASATLYTLIETAKANGLEPYRYLRFLFEKLPKAKSREDYKALLPPYIDKAQLVLPV
jgi:transposase